MTLARAQSVDTTERAAAAATTEGFASLDEALGALIDDAHLDNLRARLDAHADALSRERGVLAQSHLQNLPAEPIDPDAAAAEVQVARAAYEEAMRAAAEAQARLRELRRDRQALARDLEVLGDRERRYDVLHRLSETVRGRTPNMRGIPLDSYVAAAELETILDAANGRLRAMSDGRYELRPLRAGRPPPGRRPPVSRSRCSTSTPAAPDLPGH